MSDNDKRPDADQTDAETEGVEPIPEPEGDPEIIETDYTIGQDNLTG